MKTFKVNIGDIVEIHGWDLVNYRDGEQGDVASFIMFGKIEEINKEQIKIVMAEITEGKGVTSQEGFDERFSLPIGCIEKIIILKKGKKDGQNRDTD